MFEDYDGCITVTYDEEEFAKILKEWGEDTISMIFKQYDHCTTVTYDEEEFSKLHREWGDESGKSLKDVDINNIDRSDIENNNVKKKSLFNIVDQIQVVELNTHTSAILIVYIKRN